MEYDKHHSKDAVQEEITDKSRVTNQLLLFQDEKGMLKGIESTLSGYVEELRQEEPCCPLCLRSFEQVPESHQLILKLEERMQVLSLLISEKEEEVAQLLERLLDPVTWLQRDDETLIDREPDDFSDALYQTVKSATSLSERSASPQQSVFSLADVDLDLPNVADEEESQGEDEVRSKMESSQSIHLNSQRQTISEDLKQEGADDDASVFVPCSSQAELPGPAEPVQTSAHITVGTQGHLKQTLQPIVQPLRYNQGLRVVQPEGSPLFKCSLCNSCYLNERFYDLHLQKHKKQHLKNKKAALRNKRKIETTINLTSRKETVRITKCTKNPEREHNVPQEPIAYSGHQELSSDDPLTKDVAVSGTLEKLNVETYSCTKCEKVFSQQNVAIKHFKDVHQIQKYVTCPICDQRFNREQSLWKHMNKHNKLTDPYLCSNCGQTFSNKKSLDRHVKVHLEKKILSCPKCGKQFKKNAYLKLHELSHQNPLLEQYREEALRKLDKLPDPFLCSDCGEKFSNKKSLNLHVKNHLEKKRLSCAICGKQFKLHGFLKLHELSHQNTAPKVTKPKVSKPCTCPICGKILSCKGTLTLHKYIHTGEKPHSCEVCHRKYRKKADLNNHMNFHLGVKGNKEIKCDRCEKVFMKEKTFNNHMCIHKDRKFNTFSCKKCGRGFCLESSLRRHELLHSDLNKVFCDQCGRGFTERYHLKNHIDVVHKGIKRFKCSICNKGFPCNRQLIEHELVHNPLAQKRTCGICMQTFESRFDLAKHMKTHLTTDEAIQT